MYEYHQCNFDILATDEESVWLLWIQVRFVWILTLTDAFSNSQSFWKIEFVAVGGEANFMSVIWSVVAAVVVEDVEGERGIQVMI